MDCEPLLSRSAMPIYWISVLIFTTAIVVLIICIAYTKINVQSTVALHSLINIWIMLLATLIALGIHHDYDDLYPFYRNIRSDSIPCIIYGALSIISLVVPSTSLVLLSIIHYRAVFWSRFDYKLKRRHIIIPVLLIWLTTAILVTVWTSLHTYYSSWYCLPFTTAYSLSWAPVFLQPVLIISSITSLITFVICYVKMILQVHKEEALVMTARSKKISTTRQLVVKFCITGLLYASQLSLMITMMVLALLGSDDVTQSVCYIAYFVTVDLYLHAFLVIKKMILK